MSQAGLSIASKKFHLKGWMPGCAAFLLIPVVCAFSQVPFESEIREFERIDVRDGFFPASIFFVGSSSIRMWNTLSSDMSPLPVLSRGFGGASLSHVAYYADRFILPHNPKMIVLYAGENDLAYEGGTIGNLIGYFNAWSNYLKSKLPDTQLYFISIKPSIARWQYWEKMKEANRQIKEIIDREPNCHFIDVASAMLATSGYVREDIFLSDNLHMNAVGYAIWTSVIKPKMTEEYSRVFGTQNRPPADIALINRTIMENEKVGTEVGWLTTFDPDAGDVHTYALVAGTGDSGNGMFSLESGGRLRSAVKFNYEQKSSYSIRVSSTDKAGGRLEKSFNIDIINVNDPPQISNLKIQPDRPRENESLNLIYTFYDEDVGDSESGTRIRWVKNGVEMPEWSERKTISSSSFEAGQRWHAIVQPSDGKVFGVEYNSAVVEIIMSNRPPSDIVLSQSRVAENMPVGAEVGSFSSADPNPGDSHTYMLVPGAGDSGNSAFNIEPAGRLRTSISFDFENRSNYGIRVRSTDESGAWFEKQITIAVTDMNEPPWISGLVILPEQPRDNVELRVQYQFADPDAGNTEKGTAIRWYRNDKEEADLKGYRTVPPNRLAEGEYWNVMVKPSDGSLFGQEVMSETVEILTSNVAPHDISLSNAKIAENKPSGTKVGMLKAVDENPDDTHTFSLVDGDGAEDNGRFLIRKGNELVSAEKFDFEIRNRYSVRIAATDLKDGRVEKVFSIDVLDVDDPPVALLSRVDLYFDEDDQPGCIDLSDLFYDQDGDSIAISITANNNDQLLTAAMDNHCLSLSLLPDAYGKASLSLKATARSRSAKSEVCIHVAPVDDPPRLTRVLPVVVIQENAAPTEIDLDGLFTDVDDDDKLITFRIIQVSDSGLFSAEMHSKILTIAPAMRHWGEGFIVLEAISGALSTPVEVQVLIDRITGLDEGMSSGSLVSYPNPTTGMVWINIDPEISGPLAIHVLDAAGRLALLKFLPGNLDGRIPFDLVSLPEGIYNLFLKGRGFSGFTRVMIRR